MRAVALVGHPVTLLISSSRNRLLLGDAADAPIGGCQRHRHTFVLTRLRCNVAV